VVGQFRTATATDVERQAPAEVPVVMLAVVFAEMPAAAHKNVGSGAIGSAGIYSAGFAAEAA